MLTNSFLEKRTGFFGDLNTTEYFYHTDGLGSITGLSDINGNIVQSYSYSSFGETKVYNQAGTEINPSQMISSPYGFTGREWDFETGLFFYNSRYYDQRIGRFISEDTVGLAGGDSNLYRYVKNGPTINTDPNGKWLVPAAFIIGGGVAGAWSAYANNLSRNAIIASMTAGFISGAISGLTASYSMAPAFLIATISGSLNSLAQQYINSIDRGSCGTGISLGKAGLAGVLEGGAGLFGGEVAGRFSRSFVPAFTQSIGFGIGSILSFFNPYSQFLTSPVGGRSNE